MHFLENFVQAHHAHTYSLSFDTRVTAYLRLNKAKKFAKQQRSNVAFIAIFASMKWLPPEERRVTAVTPRRENAISFRSFWRLRREPLFSPGPLAWISAMKMFLPCVQRCRLAWVCLRRQKRWLRRQRRRLKRGRSDQPNRSGAQRTARFPISILKGKSDS